MGSFFPLRSSIYTRSVASRRRRPDWFSRRPWRRPQIVTPSTGALLDRYSAKAIVVAGSLAGALGYPGFAFVEHPWEAFACAVVSGTGLGAALTANRTLVVWLVTPEQRAAAFALNRVAGNFGVG
jgi:MFS family permease